VEAKKEILRDQLRRIGKIEAPAEIGAVTGEPWHYRNRSQFHIDGGGIGYLEARSHKLCPVAACPISSPAVNATLGVLVEMLHDPRWPRFVRSLEVFTDERQVQVNILETARPVARRFFDWCAERIPGWVSGPLEYEVAGTSYRVSGESFFQVNRHLAAKLVETAIEGAGGGPSITWIGRCSTTAPIPWCWMR
jgi:23S rRNA (uracil1939-C5)-methyltransferase